MTDPDYRTLPEPVDLTETVEEVDVSPPPGQPLVEELPQPDKGWFQSGG